MVVIFDITLLYIFFFNFRTELAKVKVLESIPATKAKKEKAKSSTNQTPSVDSPLNTGKEGVSGTLLNNLEDIDHQDVDSGAGFFMSKYNTPTVLWSAASGTERALEPTPGPSNTNNDTEGRPSKQRKGDPREAMLLRLESSDEDSSKDEEKKKKNKKKKKSKKSVFQISKENLLNYAFFMKSKCRKY